MHIILNTISQYGIYNTQESLVKFYEFYIFKTLWIQIHVVLEKRKKAKNNNNNKKSIWKKAVLVVSQSLQVVKN